MAAIRIGQAGAVADNFARGGTAAPVELPTGRLGRGTGATTRSLPLSLTHTASGVPIAGLRLPFWDEVLDLSATVHRSLEGFLFLAQDIAITESGPVIVEVNEIWTPHVLQKSHDVGLGQTEFPAAVLKALPRRLW